jgi:hypothetical protein
VSTVKQDVGSASAVHWGEHFFFTANNLTIEDVETAKITIELKNHNMLLSNNLVGGYEMDLTYVYSQPNHALIHKWIAVSNSEAKDFQACRGYLKFGVSVLAEGDK